jgi:prevent-host-death family protein
LTNSDPGASVVVMSRMLNLYDAKAQLSALVEEAAAGGEIIIAKAGRPRARLVPVRQATRRRPGRAKGKIWMAGDFDAPLPAAILRAFAGDRSG